MLEKTLESSLEFKEVHPADFKGNQPWLFIIRSDTDAEALILWLLDVNSWLTEKDPDDGKDWRQKEKKGQTMRWLDSTSDSVNMNWSKLWETVEDGVAWYAAGLQRNRYVLATEQLNVLAVMFRNY